VKIAKQLKLTFKAFLLVKLSKRKATCWQGVQFNRILILRYDRIGDMVVTTPLIRELRRFYPSAQIDVLATVKNSAVLTHNQFVSTILIYPETVFGKCFTLLRARGAYELIIDLNHSLVWQSIFELRLLKPKVIIAPKKGARYGVDPKTLGLYDRLSEESVERPLARVYLDLLKLLGKGDTSALSVSYDVPVGYHSRLYATRSCGTLLAPFYGVNLSGGRASMSLTDADLVLIVAAIFQNAPCGTVLLFSDPNSYKRVQTIYRRYFLGNHRVSLLEPTKCVIDAVAIIERLSILVTPDTSLVHFACAKNIPLVAIYANEPALFTQWQPVSDAPWRACFSKSNKSLDGCRVEDVISYINQLMNRQSPRRLTGVGSGVFSIRAGSTDEEV
jgi:ADP-heptose:LPS heptosyltransferase